MLSLSILIVLHEAGHFFPARWFGTRVEKFYLFFDPWFSLVKKKIGETEYGIGWLPLGGYVKIAGMVDESFDRDQMKGEPQEWEFRSKPAWQRLIIMLGGVTVNFILGFLIFGMVLFFYGEQYLPSANVPDGIAVDSLGYEMGLRDGDKVLQVGNTPFEKFSDRTVLREVVINNAQTIAVERNGTKQQIPVDPKFVSILSSYEYKNSILFEPRLPLLIQEVEEGSPADLSGILPNDKIISLNGTAAPYLHTFREIAQQNKGQETTIGFIRNNRDTISTSITLTENGTIGILSQQPELATQEYSFAEAIPAGVVKGVDFLSDQFKAFGQMFRGKIKASESLGGFGTIAGMYGTEWNWQRFWTMTAILSLILAFMNLLPIPALDGGHVMFLLYEMLSGRKPSDRFMEIATLAGFIIVLGLVLFANGLDVFRKFF